jgi:hypothetical protein
MRRIRLVFAWCFAGAALVSIALAGEFLWLPIEVGADDFPPAFAVKALLVALSLGFAFLFGAAWWTVLKNKISARGSAIAASLVPVLLGVLQLYYRPHAWPNLGWVLLVLGALGVAAFLRRPADAPLDSRRVARRPLPGDGTNAIINRLIGIAAAAAGWIGLSTWDRWARVHDLPIGPPAHIFLEIVGAILLVLVFHEGGHALAGMALRMKLISFVIGPFRWRIVEGRWKFQFLSTGLFSLIGHTIVVPKDTEGFQRRKIVQVAAGPFASILTGLLASAAILLAPRAPWADTWRFLSYFATISLLTGVLNLVPFGIGSGYSDGAKLYQLASGRLWCEYQQLLGVIYSIIVTPTRPGDFDIEAIRQTAGTVAKGTNELFLYLAIYSCLLDRGELNAATEALARAELFCQESTLDPPWEWCSAFVFGNALLRRDAAAARGWWQKMEAKRRRKPAGESWMALSALLWSEGKLAEARETWAKADAWVSRLPESGFAAAERDALHLLRQALDEAAHTADDLSASHTEPHLSV